MWNGKDRLDKESQSIIITEAKREHSDSDAQNLNEDPDLDDFIYTKSAFQMYEHPKIVDTIVVLSGSGVPNFVSVNSSTRKKAMSAFKLVCMRMHVHVYVYVCICLCEFVNIVEGIAW